MAEPRRRTHATRRGASAGLATLLGCVALAGCGDAPRSTDAGAGDTTSAPQAYGTTPPDVAVTSDGLAYLALGDSLSRGVQPDPKVTLRHGYPRQLAARLARRFGPVALVEAGCGGATTASFISGGKDCPGDAPVPYANADARTGQLAWAESWLRSRGARPTLVTLSLGANDALACASADAAAVQRCFVQGKRPFADRIAEIIDRLGRAAGPGTVFAVATLYDPVLGAVARDGAVGAAVAAFHAGVVGEANPLLRARFGSARWKIADVGGTMHEDAPVTATSASVTSVCRLTWACKPQPDIHLTTAGYAMVALLHEREVVAPLRQRLAASQG